jgi:protein ImuA
MALSPELVRLLEHPGIWRGTSVARTDVISSGFAALDERLPGGGWPRSGLIEILVPRLGVGELTLLLPVLATLTRASMARSAVWVSPPFEPFAPALAARCVVLERILIVRVPEALRSGALWAFEQSLGSNACDLVMSWALSDSKGPRAKQIRRLQLAAERGRALGVLFRPLRAARESSHAALRLAIEPSTYGVRINLFKSKGGVRGSVDLELTAAGG